MHLINPTILAQNLLPPMATGHLVLLRGISITPQHPRMGQSHLRSNVKKQCQVVTKDTVKRAQLNMGMFWLSNPKMKIMRSSFVTCMKRFASSSAEGGKNARGTQTSFVHFFILIHQKT
jgi:hypothetical protein